MNSFVFRIHLLSSTKRKRLLVGQRLAHMADHYFSEKQAGWVSSAKQCNDLPGERLEFAEFISQSTEVPEV